MKTIFRFFLKGMAVTLPLVLTLYLLYWMGTSAEKAAQSFLQRAIEADAYIPGMGIAVAVAVVIAAGILTEFWIVRKLIGLFESLLMKLPVVKTIYGGIRDLMGFLSSVSEEKKSGKVVMVNLAGGIRILGFVTRESFRDLPGGIGDADCVAVYLPMSYQLGGFTLTVPRTAVEPVAMPAEDAMRFALTAWMTRDESDEDGLQGMKEKVVEK